MIYIIMRCPQNFRTNLSGLGGFSGSSESSEWGKLQSFPFSGGHTTYGIICPV